MRGDSDHRKGVFAAITVLLLFGIGLIAWGLIDELIYQWTHRDWWWPM